MKIFSNNLGAAAQVAATRKTSKSGSVDAQESADFGDMVGFSAISTRKKFNFDGTKYNLDDVVHGMNTAGYKI